MPPVVENETQPTSPVNQPPHLLQRKQTEGRQNLLITLSLLLTLLVFWGPPLLNSLERSSVQGVIEQRQLELQSLAQQAFYREVPTNTPDQNTPLLSQQLFGPDPLHDLAHTLQERQQNSTSPDPDLQLRLVLVLLAINQPHEALPLVEHLSSHPAELSGAKLTLHQALLQRVAGSSTAASALDGLGNELLVDALPNHPLYQSLACSALDLDRPFCHDSHGGALWRLVLVSLVGPLALVSGLVLWLVQLGRFLWSWNRPRPSPPQLTAPLTVPALLLFFFGGVVVLGNVSGGLVFLALQPWLHSSSSQGQALSTMLLYGGQALPGLGVLAWQRRREGQSGWQWLHWRLGCRSLPMALQYLLLSLPLVLLTSWGVSQLFPQAGGSNPLLELVLESKDWTALALFALTACLLAPLYEELVFRATILPTVVNAYGAVVGVILSSLLFAAAHLSLVEFFPLLILGLGLGWLRLSSGSLSACVLMHAAWNSYTLVNLALLGL